MKEKIKQIITIIIFVAIIFTMAAMTVFNLYKKYQSSGVPQFTITSFENDFKTNLYLRQDIIETQGLTQKWIGNNSVEDPETGKIVKNNWGQLSTLPGRRDFSDFFAKLDAITNACKNSNTKQIYVQAPFKILPGYEKEQLPAGFTTEANNNADLFMTYMSEQGVEVFDLRDYLLAQTDIPVNEIFYKTDHHWTVPAAYSAFSGFLKHLKDSYNYCTDEELAFLTNKENFNFLTMENCYLGSWGRRTGLLYAGAEDFTYIVPDFETNFYMKRVAGQEYFDTTGSFYDVIMSPKRVEKEIYGPSDEDLAAGFGDNGIYTDLYSVYMDGFVAEMQLVNNLSNSDKKILIFQDSFGFPFSPFMALSAKETRIIDIRNWNEDINQYISEYQPHFVITLYNPDQ